MVRTEDILYIYIFCLQIDLVYEKLTQEQAWLVNSSILFSWQPKATSGIRGTNIVSKSYLECPISATK